MYKIRGGDGKEYGPVSADTLKQWVSEGRANAQTLILPPAAAIKVAQAQTQTRAPVATVKVTRHISHAGKARRTARASTRTHTIRRGDTLTALARHYKVTVADIRESNGSLKVLRPGTKIHIPYDS